MSVKWEANFSGIQTQWMKLTGNIFYITFNGAKTHLWNQYNKQQICFVYCVPNTKTFLSFILFFFMWISGLAGRQCIHVYINRISSSCYLVTTTGFNPFKWVTKANASHEYWRPVLNELYVAVDRIHLCGMCEVCSLCHCEMLEYLLLYFGFPNSASSVSPKHLVPNGFIPNLDLSVWFLAVFMKRFPF